MTVFLDHRDLALLAASFLIVVFLVVRGRYRLHVRKDKFELLLEPRATRAMSKRKNVR